MEARQCREFMSNIIANGTVFLLSPPADYLLPSECYGYLLNRGLLNSPHLVEIPFYWFFHPSLWGWGSLCPLLPSHTGLERGRKKKKSQITNPKFSRRAYIVNVLTRTWIPKQMSISSLVFLAPLNSLKKHKGCLILPSRAHASV